MPHRARVRHALTLLLAPLLCAACHDGTAPHPASGGPVSGTWVQQGVDTYIVLSLRQHGASVSGAITYSSPMGPSQSYPVAGTFSDSVLVIHWQEGRFAASFSGKLSADHQSLIALPVSGATGPPSAFQRLNGQIG